MKKNDMVELNVNMIHEESEIKIICEECNQMYALEIEPDGRISLMRCETCKTTLVIDDPILHQKLIRDLKKAGAKEIHKRKPNLWEYFFGAKSLDVSDK